MKLFLNNHKVTVCVAIVALASGCAKTIQIEGLLDTGGHGGAGAPATVQFAQTLSTAPNESGTASLSVTILGASTLPVTVDFAVTGGSATNPADFSLAAGTLTFVPGETAKAIDIVLNDDSLDEEDETIVVTLSNALGAELGSAVHTLTIFR